MPKRPQIITRLETQHPITQQSFFLRSWDRATLMYSFKYKQQDATLYNILYYCQCCTCFRQFLRPSSGAKNCTHSIWYMSSLLAATASVGELEQ
jgi:hypothetical protein